MKLYVGNMPFSMDEGQVRALFEAHGTVDSVAIITDRETGRPRGFGFVEMSDDESSRAAMQALDNHMVEGRNLKVNEAKPRNTGGGGGGGGRGGGGGGGGRW
jgi:RNA recognition motif-containing protein